MVSLVEIHGGALKTVQKNMYKVLRRPEGWSIYIVTTLSHWLRAAPSGKKEQKEVSSSLRAILQHEGYRK